MNEENNRFTESEIIVGTVFALGVDGVSALIDFTGVGMGIAPVIQGGAIFAIDRWVENKGGGDFGLGKKIAQYGAGLMPVLPTTTGVFVIRVMMHNHPKVTATAGKVVGKIGPAGKVASKVLKKAA